jgi:hypothetical protein
MKTLNYLLIAVLAIIGLTTSCTKDDVLVAPDAPTITVTSVPEITAGAEFAPGTEIIFTINAAVEDGKLYQLTVTTAPPAEDGTLSSHVYNMSETVTYKYIVPFGGGSGVNINFAVKAVNTGDISLSSVSSTDVAFNILQSWTEYENLTLYSAWNADSTVNSILRLDDGTLHSYQSSYEGTDEFKLSLDFIMQPKGENEDGVQTAIIGGTGVTQPGFTNLYLLWGDGDWEPKRRFSVYSSEGLTVYNNLDYDGFNPEDLYTSPSASATIKVGDIITFDNATVGGYNPDGDPIERTNPDVIGAIKITEINPGTLEDHTDGYVKFSYKVKTK